MPRFALISQKVTFDGISRSDSSLIDAGETKIQEMIERYEKILGTF
jgi:hypothetical protein